jgi:hypothetical protein
VASATGPTAAVAKDPSEKDRKFVLFFCRFFFVFFSENRVRCKPVGPSPGKGADGRSSLPICGPKADGTYWVECRTADGRVHRAMLESRA